MDDYLLGWDATEPDPRLKNTIFDERSELEFGAPPIVKRGYGARDILLLGAMQKFISRFTRMHSRAPLVFKEYGRLKNKDRSWCKKSGCRCTEKRMVAREVDVDALKKP